MLEPLLLLFLTGKTLSNFIKSQQHIASILNDKSNSIYALDLATSNYQTSFTGSSKFSSNLGFELNNLIMNLDLDISSLIANHMM